MPTLLYGLTLTGDPAPDARGVAGSPVRTLNVAPLTAIVSDLPAKPEASIAAIREYDAVLGRFVAAGATVAAVRFGQLFADDAACLDEVRDHGARVAALLRDSRGCVEMRVLLPVTASDEDQPTPPRASAAGPGRAYLESLRARGEVARHLALAPMLGGVVRAEKMEGFASRRSAVRGVAFAHLVHRDDLRAYRAAVRALPALAEARVVGPLPLYSFAEPAA